MVLSSTSCTVYIAFGGGGMLCFNTKSLLQLTSLSISTVFSISEIFLFALHPASHPEHSECSSVENISVGIISVFDIFFYN